MKKNTILTLSLIGLLMFLGIEVGAKNPADRNGLDSLLKETEVESQTANKIYDKTTQVERFKQEDFRPSAIPEVVATLESESIVVDTKWKPDPSHSKSKTEFKAQQQKKNIERLSEEIKYQK